MDYLLIILAGISTIIIALWWWNMIQVSRKNDIDFDQRDEAKEDLEKHELFL